MKKLMMSLAVPALLAGCGKDEKPQKPSSFTEQVSGLIWNDQTQENVITIKNYDGEALAGAQILIGSALNIPFEGNFLTADADGRIEIPAQWNTTEPITVHAPGYMRLTYLNQEPGALNIRLRAQPTKIQHEVTGTTLNLPIVHKDGWADFGLVMPAFSKLDMLSFSMDRVISPQTDRITPLGQQIDVPSNISLPSQEEKFGIFTVKLDKPIYRIYYGNPGVNRVFAARGRFPFRSTVDQLRAGKAFYELINDFKIHGGAVRDLEIKSSQTKIDLPTNELAFAEPKVMVAPAVKHDEIFIAISVANQSGYLIPTDFKKIPQFDKAELNILPGAEALALGVLKKSEEMKTGGDRMSAALAPFVSGITPKMLPMIADPRVSGDDVIMPKFSAVAGINPIATYSVLSNEEEVQQGAAKVKIQNPQWEIYATTWLESMKVPRWPTDKATPGKKRWAVSFVGSQTASQAPVGPAMIEAATHVTHSTVSF